MDRRHLQLVLRHAAATACPAEPDALLLKRYARERDEVAFAELVRRHGRLVWALCRNLLPSEADADDAFQATFLALAKSANTIRDAARLGPWLHGVAYRVCLKAKREAARRKRRQEVASSKEAVRPVADSAWDAALAAVHEEVHRLPEPLRVAFVLCCLEGKGATEAAEQLGWKLGTLSGRLTRAKETILARLAARGIAAAVAGAAAVSGGASGSVPAAVLARTAELIVDGATVPSSILSLSHGVVGMAVHRTKFLAAVVLVAGRLSMGIGSGWVANAQQPAKPQDAPTTKAVADDVKKLQDDLDRALQLLEKQRAQGEAEKKYVGDLFEFYQGFLNDTVLAQDKIARREAAVASTKKWDYDFVLASEMGTTKFVQFLQDRETRGWDYVGETTLNHQEKMLPHWVFRRPVRNTAKVQELTLDLADKFLVEAYIEQLNTTEAARRTEADAKKPPVSANIPALGPNRVAELEAQIKQLQAQLDVLRKTDNQWTKIPRKELGGFDPVEMMGLLNTLAKKRFDAGQKPLQLTADSEGLSLQGSPEAVKWAREMIKKLTEK